MNEIERIELVMTKGEHTDGDLAFAVEQWKAALLKLQACSEERDRYKHLAETGTTYVDAIAMRDERDKLACRLDAREKELEELARHADHLNSRIVALDDELLDSTAAAERYALRLGALLEAAEKDIADAKHVCGGDGEGCETYRGYYETAERRHQKCSHCPMGATFHIRAAVDCKHPEQFKSYEGNGVWHCNGCKQKVGVNSEPVVEKGDFKFYNSVCGICGRTEPHSHNIPSE